jgi:hypothetical protein
MRGSTVYRLYTPKQLHRKIPTDFTENTRKTIKNTKVLSTRKSV